MRKTCTYTCTVHSQWFSKSIAQMNINTGDYPARSPFNEWLKFKCGAHHKMRNSFAQVSNTFSETKSEQRFKYPMKHVGLDEWFIENLLFIHRISHSALIKSPDANCHRFEIVGTKHMNKHWYELYRQPLHICDFTYLLTSFITIRWFICTFFCKIPRKKYSIFQENRIFAPNENYFIIFERTNERFYVFCVVFDLHTIQKNNNIIENLIGVFAILLSFD